MKRVTTPMIILVALVIVVGGSIVYQKKHSDLVSTPSACVNNPLSAGAQGRCVSDLQTLLNWSLYGIDGPNYKPVTGQYEATTTNQVKQFQSTNNLPVSGNLSTATWEKLCQTTDPPSAWTNAAKDAGCRL